LGIEPKYPETGYGYIKVSRLIDDNILLYGIKGFKEKPDKQLAKYYHKIGGYYWNCGILITKGEIILEEIKDKFKKLYDFIQNNSYEMLIKNFNIIPNIPIEKAIIEKSRRLGMIEAKFDWSDLGSWESYFKYIRTNNENITEINGFNNRILTDKKIIMIDMENTTVVESPNGILIMKNESYHKLKDALNDNELNK